MKPILTLCSALTVVGSSFVSIEDSVQSMQMFSTKYKLNYGLEI